MDDGTLTISVPSDIAPGRHAVSVEIDERSPDFAHHDNMDWHTFLRETAGAWRGDFERPAQGDYEVREGF
jgi:hypothetical protein